MNKQSIKLMLKMYLIIYMGKKVTEHCYYSQMQELKNQNHKQTSFRQHA